MDFALTQDQRMTLDSVKRFVTSVVKTAAPKIDEHAKMDPAVLKAASELGMPLDAVPAKYEGYLEGAYSHLNRVLRAEALAQGCAGITYQLESAVDAALALAKGDDKLQANWFPKLTGAAYATAALLGEQDGFTFANGKVSGKQTAVLLAESATLWIVKAAGPSGTVLALFGGKPKNAETFAISNTGFRACDAADVVLTEVAADDVLAEGAKADEIWQTLLDGSRLLVAALGVGNAQAAVDFAQGYANERVQFGRPIAKFQAIGQMLEESRSAIAAARLLVQSLAFRLDAGEKIATEIRNAKAHVAKVGARATIDSVQVLGGYGFVNDYPVEKYYRDARVVETLRGRDMLDILINIQAA